MSDIQFKTTLAGIELATNEQANPVEPPWLAEVLLLGEYWRRSGLLDRLQTEVRVQRGRMGDYEVCDFVLLLLAYAVSGLPTLKLFFEQLESVKSVLMAIWQRQNCPAASTLSRFLRDVGSTALEQLRALFESDLLEHGVRQTQSGGLIDRSGNRFWVFDVDGTHQAARQRSLANAPCYPEAHRRTQAATAKGYMGRSRGETTRTRSAVSQAHTSEWLGTFGAAGNGTPGPDLHRACEVIRRYLQHHQLTGDRAIIRLDGFYGAPSYINPIQQHQLGYILRSRDYTLLDHQAVQTRLKTTPKQEWTHPESHQVRAVFDLGFVEDSWAGYTLPLRLIVVRTPRDPKRQHRVGKRIGEFIYELFIASHPLAGLTGPDILSVYYGRGGFEKVLADEDREGDCDRWCSWNPTGQEFWQILSQWVWNWRLWAGLAHHPQTMRQTVWSPADEGPREATPSSAPIEEPLPLSKANATRPPIDSTEHGPMELSKSWGRNRGKFSGDDFKLLDNRTLQCPAGHSMYRREVRQNRRGDLIIMFGINPRTCQQCPLKDQCLADGSKGTGGRRVTAIRKKLAPPPETFPSSDPPNPVSESPQFPPLNSIEAPTPNSTAPLPLNPPPPPQAQSNSLSESPLPYLPDSPSPNLPIVGLHFSNPKPVSESPQSSPLNPPEAPTSNPTAPLPLNPPPPPQAQSNSLSESPLPYPPDSPSPNLPIVGLHFSNLKPVSESPQFPPFNPPVAPILNPTPSPPNLPPAPHAQSNSFTEPALPPPPPPASPFPNLPVIWVDFPTTRLRRDLSHQLQRQRIVIQPVTLDLPPLEPNREPMTRDQRAHRRLTWSQRRNKNAATQAMLHWRVQLFGISSAVLEWLNRLKPHSAVTI